MKKTTKLGILAVMMLIVVMILTGCANNETKENEGDSLEGLAVYTAEDTPDWATCTEMEGVEFKYPSNYKSVGKSTMPMFMDPDVAGASINIVSSDFPDVLTFEGYVDASIPGIKSEMEIKDDNIKVEYINLNGKKAAKLDYVATSQGQTLAITQVLIKKEDKAYILTLGVLEADKEANKAQINEKYEKIVKSFQ